MHAGVYSSDIFPNLGSGGPRALTTRCRTGLIDSQYSYLYLWAHIPTQQMTDFSRRGVPTLDDRLRHFNRAVFLQQSVSARNHIIADAERMQTKINRDALESKLGRLQPGPRDALRTRTAALIQSTLPSSAPRGVSRGGGWVSGLKFRRQSRIPPTKAPQDRRG